MRAHPPSEALTADVVVIGGGAAGAAAALAARARGLQVAVVRRAWGATALSSGAADLAADPLAHPGAPRGDGRQVFEAMKTLAAMRQDHPYAALVERLESVREAVAAAEAETGGMLRFGSLDRENACLLTSLGTLKTTAGGQASILSGDLLQGGRQGVVGFVGHPQFGASHLAAGILGVPVETEFLHRMGERRMRSHEIASCIEKERERFLEAIRVALRPGIERLLLPPLMGRGDPTELLGWLSSELDLPCSEWLAGRESVPGIRLQRRLEETMEEVGIRLLHAEVFSRDGSVEGLFLQEAEAPLPPPGLFDGAGQARALAERRPEAWPIRAGAVVLATGKYIGGGLGRAGALRERVFDLPVWVEGRVDEGRWPGDLTVRDLRDPQPIFRAGVRIDGSLRPLDRRGSPRSRRLFAAGAVLAGNDDARDGAGLGLAWFTGWLAGQEASKIAAEA